MSEDEKSDVEEESQEEEQPVYKEECGDFLGDIEDWDDEEDKLYIVFLDSLPFSTILSSYIKQSGEHQLDVYYCGSLSEVKERLLGVLRLNSVVVESFISNSNDSIAKSLGVNVNKGAYTYDGANVLFIFMPNQQSGNSSIDDKDVDVFAINVW